MWEQVSTSATQLLQTESFMGSDCLNLSSNICPTPVSNDDELPILRVSS